MMFQVVTSNPIIPFNKYRNLAMNWSLIGLTLLQTNSTQYLIKTIFDKRLQNYTKCKYSHNYLKVIDENWSLNFKYEMYSCHCGYQWVHCQKYEIHRSKKLFTRKKLSISHSYLRN